MRYPELMDASRPTVYVDADACPVKGEVLTVARRHRAPVVLVANQSQNLARYQGRPGVELIEVSSGRDAADFAVVQNLRPGDIVVTQDLGLAAMALGRDAAALSPRGRVFHQATIDMEMDLLHAERKERRAGRRTGGPSPFEDEDRERFERALERLLEQGKG